MASMLGRLKNLDAYSKTLEDFKIKTFSGATSKTYKLLKAGVTVASISLVTLVSSIIILLLFLSELLYFLSTDVSLLPCEPMLCCVFLILYCVCILTQ